MKQVTPDFYQDFQCISSRCSHNCCIGWEVGLDEATCRRCLAEPGPLGDKLRREIVTEPYPNIRLTAEKRCPFLDGNNLCEIISAGRTDLLGEICREHPRFREWFPGRVETGLGLCCEEAARLLYSHEGKITLTSTEVPDEPWEEPDWNETRYQELLLSRDAALELVQQDTLMLKERIGLLLTMAEQLQRSMDSDPEAELGVLSARYLEQETQQKVFFSLQGLEQRKTGLFEQAIEELLSLCTDMEPLDPHWREQLIEMQSRLPELEPALSDYLTSYPQAQKEYERFLCYWIFRYWMKAAYNDELLIPVKMAAVSLLMLMALDADTWKKNHTYSMQDRISLSRRYSSEIEYAVCCRETLEEECWTNPLFSTLNLWRIFASVL